MSSGFYTDMMYGLARDRVPLDRPLTIPLENPANIIMGENNVEMMGEHNTAVGYYAGSNLTTGSNNVLIGYRAAPELTTENKQIIIAPEDANVVRIGGIDLKKLVDRLEYLEKRVEELEELSLAPGGSAFRKAQSDFEKLVVEQSESSDDQSESETNDLKIEPLI